MFLNYVSKLHTSTMVKFIGYINATWYHVDQEYTYIRLNIYKLNTNNTAIHFIGC